MTRFSASRRVIAAGLFAGLLPWSVCAQLSSPIAGASAPAGTGAGIHSPNSPFAPLQERADVVPWSVLTDVKTRVEKNRILPVFSTPVMALNQKSQRVQRFMMPLDPGGAVELFVLCTGGT